MVRKKTIQKTIKQKPFTKKHWTKTVLFAAPGGIAVAVMIAAMLAGCATPSLQSPMVVNGKLIVPDGGILLEKGPHAEGAQ